MFDPAPDEPDEWLPEDRWGDPERDLPRVPKAPSTRDTTENEVSAEVATAFWGVVLIVNIGLFAAALGPMLVFFNGQWELGGGLTVFGLLALGHAYSRYRTFKHEQDAKTTETTTESAAAVATESDGGDAAAADEDDSDSGAGDDDDADEAREDDSREESANTDIDTDADTGSGSGSDERKR